MLRPAVAIGLTLAGRRAAPVAVQQPATTWQRPEPLTRGDLGWQYHTGGHAATRADWTAFLTFLAEYFTLG